MAMIAPAAYPSILSRFAPLQWKTEEPIFKKFTWFVTIIHVKYEASVQYVNKNYIHKFIFPDL